jgi:Uma2 family endonuclease
VGDLLHALGDVPAERVRLHSSLGETTLEDLIAANDNSSGVVCEWADGALVEKAMGQFESWLGIIIAGELYIHLRTHDAGMLYGEAAVLQILPGIGRAPVVSFISWQNLPGGKPPARSDRVPAVVPDLVVEILSTSNTPGEMARKRGEYFRAGVKYVWEIDPDSRSANAFSSVDSVTPIPPDGFLDGGAVLPGFRLSLRELFDRAERRS